MNAVQVRPTKVLSGSSQEQESVGKSPAVEFYDELPNLELSLDEFEVYALARLTVRYV